MAEHPVGTVIHYFGKPQVGIVSLTADISIGDTLGFRGHGADFQQTVRSMQVEHAAVETAPSGTEVGIRVDQRVREGTVQHVFGSVRSGQEKNRSRSRIRRAILVTPSPESNQERAGELRLVAPVRLARRRSEHSRGPR